MQATVFFATNRVVNDPADAENGYPPAMVPPSSPQAITYGTAFVDGIDVATNAQGVVSQIVETQQGGFSQAAIGDLANAGRNLLVFVHGFDNTFSDAVTRAAFNRQWLADSGVTGADTTIVAFSWPSLGRIVDFPVPQGDYLKDQQMARNSGIHLMSFLANLEPILKTARANGRRTILLAHSMGNLALESGVENWFLHGNGDAPMFSETVLAAGDCGHDAFGQPNLARLSGLPRLSDRIVICYSSADQVLQLSMVINLVRRLGQDGPSHRSDGDLFPPATFPMIDCSDARDYNYNFQNSHQYYRQSPTIRARIAATLG